jgi:tetratricopeptide (TPR) repeat protein
LLVIYIICLLPQNSSGEGRFNLDTSGIFGVWRDYDLATACRNAAKNSKAADRKEQLFEVAIKEYKKVIEHVPNSGDSYNSMGVCYSGEGKIDSALYAYKMAFQLNPRFALAAYNVGLIYAKTKQYDSGIHYFVMSYKADSNLSALMDIGLSYQIQGNYAQAFHYDSLVLVKDPNNTSVLKNMAIMKKQPFKMQ